MRHHQESSKKVSHDFFLDDARGIFIAKSMNEIELIHLRKSKWWTSNSKTWPCEYVKILKNIKTSQKKFKLSQNQKVENKAMLKKFLN